jgi:pyruvate-ferredoxin/flavodoxin oxidoreductase
MSTQWSTVGIVQRAMDRFAALTARAHNLFEHDGAPDAERVLVVMRSGAASVRPTVARLGTAAKVGVLTGKLFWPFSVADFRRRSAINCPRDW